MDGKCEPMVHVVSQDPKSDLKETIIFAQRDTDGSDNNPKLNSLLPPHPEECRSEKRYGECRSEV